MPRLQMLLIWLFIISSLRWRKVIISIALHFVLKRMMPNVLGKDFACKRLARLDTELEQTSADNS